MARLPSTVCGVCGQPTPVEAVHRAVHRALLARRTAIAVLGPERAVEASRGRREVASARRMLDELEADLERLGGGDPAPASSPAHFAARVNEGDNYNGPERVRFRPAKVTPADRIPDEARALMHAMYEGEPPPVPVTRRRSPKVVPREPWPVVDNELVARWRALAERDELADPDAASEPASATTGS